MDKVTVTDTTPENMHQFSMCGYKSIKQEGYKRKIDWNKERFNEGMRYKILHSEENGSVGAIEYIPGKYSWRAIDAKEYMVIHCIYIMSKNFKGKGYGKLLLKTCIDDAKKDNLNGVAVVVRKGTWMVSKELFLKNGFELADKTTPDFELYVLKFNSKIESPKFIDNSNLLLNEYAKGLTIITSNQCPYTMKAVIEITDTAINEYDIIPIIKELKNSEDAQKSPCAFSTFCIIYNGKVVAEHPISNTRFKNIMNKQLKLK